MSLITFVEETKLPAADLNANFEEVALGGFLTAIAGEAITAKQAVCAGYYQADGGILIDGNVVTKAGTTPASPNQVVTQSLTIANHTNRVLVAFVAMSKSSNAPTNITYAGVTMTLQVNQSWSSGYKFYAYVLFAPTVGTANFSINFVEATTEYTMSFYSYYNVTQSIHLSTSGESGGSGLGINVSLTPTLDGCLLLSAGVSSGSTACNNTANNASNSPSSFGAGYARANSGSSGCVYPKKATTMSYTGASYTAAIALALSPVTAPTIGAAMVATSTALTNACNLNKAEFFIGFAQAGASAGANVVIQLEGKVTGLSGLLPFYTYYLSTTGGLAITAGNISKKVGVAISTTELVIKQDNL
jgi:hypothetical protein